MNICDCIIDSAAFRAFGADTGEAGLRSFVAAYLGLLAGRVTRIRQAVAGGDACELWTAAASLAASSSMIGALGLAAEGRRLQELADSDEMAATRALAQELDVLAGRTADGLRALLAAMPPLCQDH
ncbi:MAG TPA: hypothetical protein VKV06_01075 [Acidimicrobiales bacterium]|nr:hypothetical protein [Acidimicrobiales bacterium]